MRWSPRWLSVSCASVIAGIIPPLPRSRPTSRSGRATIFLSAASSSSQPLANTSPRSTRRMRRNFPRSPGAMPPMWTRQSKRPGGPTIPSGGRCPGGNGASTSSVSPASSKKKSVIWRYWSPSTGARRSGRAAISICPSWPPTFFTMPAGPTNSTMPFPGKSRAPLGWLARSSPGIFRC